ncbi:thioesterase family protein [Quadrisphaera sp. GCM10027208]|uniref:thioesterase family protein n=1 Tax=Quadrisphaera sp. GCM10027208 TaxID=3273423 RepID=UPI0036075FA6
MTGTYRFDAATAVTATGVPGRWRCAVDPEWTIGGRPNGGYLLALATRAALAEVDARGGEHLDPLAVSGAYLAVAPAGPLDVDVEVLRTGRGTSVLRATVHAPQDDEAYVAVTLTCGTLPAAGRGHRHDAVPPVALPPLERCVRLPAGTKDYEAPLLGQVAEHVDPDCLGWVTGPPSGRGELRGYLTFDDGRPPDALALLLAADALPPATFDLGLTGWVPTLQLSVWLRAHPAPGPLAVRQRVRVVDDGSASGGRSATVDETCDVWDSTGALVATGHQLASLRLGLSPRPAP